MSFLQNYMQAPQAYGEATTNPYTTEAPPPAMSYTGTATNQNPNMYQLWTGTGYQNVPLRIAASDAGATYRSEDIWSQGDNPYLIQGAKDIYGITNWDPYPDIGKMGDSNWWLDPTNNSADSFSYLLKSGDKVGGRFTYNKQADGSWLGSFGGQERMDTSANNGAALGVIAAPFIAAAGLSAAGGAAGAGAGGGSGLVALGEGAVPALTSAGTIAEAGAAGALGGGMSAAELAAAYGPGVMDGTAAASGFAPGAAGSAASWTPGAGVVAGEGGAATLGSAGQFASNFLGSNAVDAINTAVNTGQAGQWGDTLSMLNRGRNIFNGINSMINPQQQGGGGTPSLLDLFGAGYSANRNRDYASMLMGPYNQYKDIQRPFINQLAESYTNPNSFYQSQQYQGLKDVYKNQIDRKAAAAGRLSNPTDREVLLQKHAMAAMEDYRKGLNNAIGATDPMRALQLYGTGAGYDSFSNAPWFMAGGRAGTPGYGTNGNVGDYWKVIKDVGSTVGDVWDTISHWFG